MKTAISYVRFSSKKQEAGNSLERQSTLAIEYASKHGLALDHRSYRDLGVSAFKSKNATEGELGTFLRAIDEGKILPGSYLLVEDFDRLSRAPVMTALSLLQTLISKGITVVTLNDEKLYSTATLNTNWTDLVVALSKMEGAHAENKKKAQRVKIAWDNKVKAGKILTAMGPAWLKLNAERKAWILQPEKVEVVQQVFQLAIDGLGAPTIAHRLNDRQTPTMLKAPYWEPGVVMALLKNRAVLGDLVRRKAGGPPIPNYYPQIISPDVFYQVQEHIANRRHSGGRKGENVANLFVGLLRCECGSRMRYVSASKPHLYLRCLTAYNKQGCDAPAFPYIEMEREVMDFVLGNANIPLDQASAVDPCVALRGELAETKRKQENMLKVIMSASDVSAPAFVLEQANKLDAEVKRLEQALKTTGVSTPTSVAVQRTVLDWDHHKAEVARGGEDLYGLRLRLQAEIKRLITKMVMRRKIHGKHWEDSPWGTDEQPGGWAESAEVVLYGPFADAANRFVYEKVGLPAVDDGFATPDGGCIVRYWMPQWGINGTRRRVKATK